MFSAHAARAPVAAPNRFRDAASMIGHMVPMRGEHPQIRQRVVALVAIFVVNDVARLQRKECSDKPTSKAAAVATHYTGLVAHDVLFVTGSGGELPTEMKTTTATGAGLRGTRPIRASCCSMAALPNSHARHTKPIADALQRPAVETQINCLSFDQFRSASHRDLC